MREPNIEKTITITRATVVTRITGILNMMSKVRYDGTNARYINHLVPKIDFDSEKGLIDDIFKDSVGRLVKRIKCYVTLVEIQKGRDEQPQDPESNAVPVALYAVILNLSFPYNWATQEEDTLEDKINEYLAYQMIALWLEKTSPQDMVYYEPKAQDLLHEVRHTCEMRNRERHEVRYITD